MQFPGSAIMNPDGGAAPPPASGVSNAFWGYRIQRLSNTRMGLETVGPVNEAGGVVVPPGLGTFWDITAQEAMDAAGLTTGVKVNVSTSTIFRVYWCSAGDFSGGLGFSTTAPTQVNGIWVLGAGPVPVQCLFLGWMRTSSGGVLVDTPKDRHVVNWWNRRPTYLEVLPQYVDNNATTTFSRTSGSFISLTGTTANCQVSWLGNDGDAANLAATFSILVGDAGSNIICGIGLDAVTPLATGTISAGAFVGKSTSCTYNFLPGKGALHTATMLINTGGIAYLFVADWVRTGAAADPPATYMRGWIMA